MYIRKHFEYARKVFADNYCKHLPINYTRAPLFEISISVTSYQICRNLKHKILVILIIKNTNLYFLLTYIL